MVGKSTIFNQKTWMVTILLANQKKKKKKTVGK